VRRIPAAALFLVAISQSIDAATVPVRFSEGVTRGFLVVRDVRGSIVAHGDLVQTVNDGEIDKRMTLNFKDGSILDEKVTYTQERGFALKTYRLTEKGPTFDGDTEISLNRPTGAYRVSKRDHKGGPEKIDEGTIELPADVYNGMLMTIVKDLPPGTNHTVHFVAFTPQPRIIEIEFVPLAEREKVKIGELTRSAVHYVMKPKLGVWLKLFATVLRRVPPDLHAWILPDEIPTFVAFEGLVGTTDDVWKIEAISPSRTD
jgi:hypothetical protein